MPSSVSLSDPTYLGSGSIVLAVSATVAPSAANRSATALPSPRLPPVTSATFPAHRSGMSRDTTQMPARPLDLDHLRDRLAPLGADDVAPLAGGASSLTYSARVGGPAGRGQGRAAGAAAGPQPRRAAPGAAAPGAARHRGAGARGALGGRRRPARRCRRCSSCRSSRARRWSRCSISDGDDPEPVVAERMRDAARDARGAARPRPGVASVSPTSRWSARQREVDRWCRLLETVDPALAPGWEDVAAALRAPEPAAMPAAVVHGDFRLGNLLAVGATVTAVIDWEIWTVGDPRIDLGWFLVNADPGDLSARRRGTRVRCRRRPSCSTSTPRPSVATSADVALVRGAGVLQVDGDVVADRQAQPPPRRRPTPTSRPWRRSCPDLLARAR